MAATEFHWWCTEAPEAFSGDEPVYVSARDEIVELIGAPIYDLLVSRLEDKRPPALPTPRRTTPSPSLLVVGVVFELDAVTLGNRRVLVLFGDLAVARRRGAATTIAESEVERPRSRLLQLSRFFEAAMTTLLHAGLPTN